jgi:predicted secreted hydrolase
MKRVILALVLLALTLPCVTVRAQDYSGPATRSYPAPTGQAAAFPVAPHGNVTIEWWYLNARVTTDKGRHLAVIGSFFRFGNAHGQMAMDSKAAMPQSHYLIYAVTDIDWKKHTAYSLADKNTQRLLEQVATLQLSQDPSNERAQAILASIDKGGLPAPNVLIAQPCHVAAAPFHVSYGPGNGLIAVPGKKNTYALTLGGQAQGIEKIHLTFTSEKPPMYVNGDGNTGLRTPTDMKYVSLTRCDLQGSIDTGGGIENVTAGQGWFDHQWGDTWTTQTAGWDWFGTQLSNGTDILFFRQRDLKTGKTFFPLATFQDKSGKITVTKNIVFTPDPESVWRSAATAIRYPLNWTVAFPDQGVTLHITPDTEDQEMPVLANGGAIWEGSCTVQATTKDDVNASGVAYMELVGYGSPAVKAMIAAMAK